ncbi:hypothetical protein BX666DRAFT_1894231 [Dichotomocladium elegans]|nr:hypothetical protein BX666DRAFT_1894231 [Dichotomocladium elegans]
MIFTFSKRIHRFGVSNSARRFRLRSFTTASKSADANHDAPRQRIRRALPFFDADQFARLLEREGFSSRQARAVINALDDVVDESTTIVTADLVSKADQERTIKQYKDDFTRLKSDIQQMERRDVAEVKSANEQLQSEIKKLQKLLQDEITRTQAGVRLDLNLEKGRIRDETIEQHERLRKTDEKIESEILALKRHMEGIKLQILQYMIGTITAGGTLVLAYIHFF